MAYVRLNAPPACGQILSRNNANIVWQAVQHVLVQLSQTVLLHKTDFGEMLQVKTTQNAIPRVLLVQMLRHVLNVRSILSQTLTWAICVTAHQGIKLSLTDHAEYAHQTAMFAQIPTIALLVKIHSESKQQQPVTNASIALWTVSIALDQWLALYAPRTSSYSVVFVSLTAQQETISTRSRLLAKSAQVVWIALAQLASSTMLRLIHAHEIEIEMSPIKWKE